MVRIVDQLGAYSQGVVRLSVVSQSNVTQKFDMQLAESCLPDAWHVGVFPMNELKQLVV